MVDTMAPKKSSQEILPHAGPLPVGASRPENLQQ